MQLLYGKPVAETMHTDIKERAGKLRVRPGLAVILVGNDPASHLYVSLKEREAENDGLRFQKYVFSETDSETEVIHCIEELNQDAAVHGIIVQLPLPIGFDPDRIIATIDPEKDADGFHPENIEKFLQGEKEKIPVFPEALLELLRSSQEELLGKKAVVIANSGYFGEVMQRACSDAGMETEIVLSTDLVQKKDIVRSADVVLTACGVPGSIDSECIALGAILIDGGIAKQDGRVVGDVNAEQVALQANYLSPVPGGVGPVTIACLLRKVVSLAEHISNV